MYVCIYRLSWGGGDGSGRWRWETQDLRDGREEERVPRVRHFALREWLQCQIQELPLSTRDCKNPYSRCEFLNRNVSKHYLYQDTVIPTSCLACSGIEWLQWQAKTITCPFENGVSCNLELCVCVPERDTSGRCMHRRTSCM